MYSPYRSTHVFSPARSPRDKHTHHTENMGASVNTATAFSNLRNDNYRHSEDEDNGNTDYLDISSIDHEAIRNDPELRGKYTVIVCCMASNNDFDCIQIFRATLLLSTVPRILANFTA